MASKKLTWSRDGSYLPEILPHTKAKHQVLEDYLERYIVTLCGNNRGQRKKVTFIDGFCGGGMYLDPDNNNSLWPGSPIRMMKKVAESLDRVKREKSKPDYHLDAKFIFIDSNQNHLDCLQIQMENSGLASYVNNPEKCEFIRGEFKDALDRCLAEVRQRRGSSFFFLDPCGWTDVSMETIRQIISLGKSEILYTYMVEEVVRFLSERDKVLQDAYTNKLEAEGYYLEANSLSSNQQAKQKYVKDETYRLFRKQGKVPYLCSFALLPNKTLPLYYLIHMASHAPAQREMKYTLWNYNTIDLAYQFEYGIYGLGFRTPDYYEQNLSVIDIAQENRKRCIEKLLDEELMPLIHEENDGITLHALHTRTMQRNPATWEDYIQGIIQQRDEQELEVFRDGKITKAQNLKPGDIITKTKFKQLSLFFD